MQSSRYFWEGAKVRLRPFSPDDWREWLDDFSDSRAIWDLEGGAELPKSEAMAKAKYAEWADFGDTSKHVMFAVETLAGELVGGIAMHSRSEKNGTFSFGIRINQKHRRQGYGEDALRLLLRYGFHELRYQKCNSACVERNEGSIRLHRKLGFVDEGRRRRSVYMDGQFHDDLLFGLTREEFDENESQSKGNV